MKHGEKFGIKDIIIQQPIEKFPHSTYHLKLSSSFTFIPLSAQIFAGYMLKSETPFRIEYEMENPSI